MYRKKSSIKINKKAQEEMVGFVLIMLVVAIIFLVFLGIYIRQKPEKPSESMEISQFLDAMLEVSTECGSYSVQSVSDLISQCAASPDSKCIPGEDKTTCEAVKEIIINMTETSWEFNVNAPKTGYLYSITKETEEEVYDIPIFDPASFSYSQAEGRVIGHEKILSGGIHIYLQIYTK